MRSPDTDTDADRLATVPLPAGVPDSERAADVAQPPAGREDARTGRREQTEPAAVAEQRTEPHARPDPEAAEAQTARRQRPEPAAEPLTEPHELPEAAEARTEPQERVEPELVEPAAAEATETASADEPTAPAKDRGRWWRGFTGSLAAGLTVLAVGVLVVAGICLYTGAPGPGAALLIGHPVAAALALSAQRVADRRTGAPAVGAGVAVVLFTASALTIFWLT